MISDRFRMAAYLQALRQTIRPNSVVLDIGTGTGIFAVLATQFGARRVYAVDPSDAIQVAKEIAVSNGFAERIDFVQGLSTDVTLPERADVVISDMRGILPLLQHHIDSIIDARQRLLDPGGVLIPQSDELWAAVVQAPQIYTDYATPWSSNEYGLDMRCGKSIVTNTWNKRRFKPEQLLVSPQPWAVIDYATVSSSDVSAEIDWTVNREGTGHGLAVWFDAILAEGIGFSNAPGQPELIYSNAFFPWSEAVALELGDFVSVKIKANLVGDDYIWSWDTRVLRHGNPRELKASFKQSTFFGVPLSPRQLQKQADSYVPKLGEKGEIDRFILELMDGRTSLREIATALSARYPTHFRTREDARNRVSELSRTYSD